MPKKDILLIDDDPDFVEATRAMLKKAGFNVRFASGSREGLLAMKKKKPNLIIMDVMMDTITEGFDLAKELRDKKDFSDVPILIVTALQLVTEFDDKRKLRDWLPADAYIEKPIDPKVLLTRINKMCG